MNRGSLARDLVRVLVAVAITTVTTFCVSMAGVAEEEPQVQAVTVDVRPPSAPLDGVLYMS